MQDDMDFPRFEIMRFPARAVDYRGEGQYPNEYLFEERYSKQWYLSQYSVLGKYAAAALLDCDPILRGGGRLSTDGIVYEDSLPNVENGLPFPIARVWDLAHTKKQRSKEDPDWTSGTKLGFERRKNDPVLHLWIVDVIRTREGVLQRDAAIRRTAQLDGTMVQSGIEISLDSGDAFEYLRASLPEISWKRITTSGDKSARATPLESIFETPGHVHVVRGAWNNDWLDEVLRFDGTGKDHDDQIDNMSAGYIMLVKSQADFSFNIGRIGL
jgi:predicted phage terminase large subunit-like protein